MHFNVTTSLAIMISLAGITTAVPTSAQYSHLEKRKERPNISVKVYTDDYCTDETGSYGDNKPWCENLDNFAVDVLSINAEVDGDILNGSNCGWTVFAYPELDCKGDGPEAWNRLLEGSCRKDELGIPRKPIKSFAVYEFGPCN
ncbi:hypothetical protein BKA59DRAFT_513045 [Fusarium tricinctum]|uniref:Ecp2 effector protein domain-containing protein n=1 Tax=Fusarium tricinctum TaxID=61284 RepID=A0A8K0RSX4_9HYPO|nr:hypothetical protein BKA59DRAFT_513045 [Fusarium tricinctum]